MKQSSTTSRGKKKSAGSKSSASRSSASQHRSGGKNSSSGSHNSNSSGRGSNGNSSGRSSSANSGRDSSGNSGGRGSNGSSGRSSGSSRSSSESSASGSSQRNSMRGNNSSGSTSRSRTGSPAAPSGSHEGHFEGQSYLEKFFLDQLQDIYYAEHKITQSLPKMIEATTTDELSEAFDDHLHQTQRHIKRLEKVFESLGKQAEGKKCEAIEGIAREVDQIIEETEEGSVTRDAALIIAAQKVEHYEIATYGGLVQLAITMQLHDAADLLDKTLLEEEDTDALLTEIAENDINLQAENEGNEYSWNATMIYAEGGQEEGEQGEESGEEEEEGEEESGENESEETESPSLQ